MAGRPAQKVYLYDACFKYTLVETFDSINDYRKMFYPDDKGKRPLFKDNYELENGYYASLEPDLTEDMVKFNVKKAKSSLLMNTKPTSVKHPIAMINMDGHVIATFPNPLMASKILGVRKDKITSCLDKQTPFVHLDYYFKSL